MFSLEVSTECFYFILIIEFQPLFLSKKVLKKNPKNSPYLLRILPLKKSLIFHKILLESLYHKNQTKPFAHSRFDSKIICFYALFGGRKNDTHSSKSNEKKYIEFECIFIFF
jgi:hypothetical protein